MIESANYFCIWNWHAFSIKGQKVNMFSIEGHVVPAVASQLCCCDAKVDRQYTNRWAWLSSYKTSFTKTARAGQIWSICWTLLYINGIKLYLSFCNLFFIIHDYVSIYVVMCTYSSLNPNSATLNILIHSSLARVKEFL